MNEYWSTKQLLYEFIRKFLGGFLKDISWQLCAQSTLKLQLPVTT